MKRLQRLGVLFLIVFALVFSSFVSAACDSSQAVLNLSSSSNAHATFYNQNVNYPYGICFNERFTSSFSGTSPHECISGITNGVIGLSALYNAHVEDVVFSNYTNSNDVCYGNLICNLRVGTGGHVPCLSGEANIFSISSLSNAHAAKLGDYVYTLCCSAAGYTPKCNNDDYCDDGESADNCCDCVGSTNALCNYNYVAPSGYGISNVYWSNGSIAAGILEVVNGSYVNNSVYLVADMASGTPNGTVVVFEVYESDSSSRAQIKTLRASVVSNRAYVEWPITDTNIAAGGAESDGMWEFYFNATSGAFNKLSNQVYVRNINGPNVFPVVNITSPTDDSVYFLNQMVNFSAKVFDRDGRVANVQWNIADVITNSEKNSTFFQHNYTSVGDKIITLTITDNDGTVSTVRVVITVVGSGVNVHTKINKPYHGEDIFNYSIAYNGSGSWAVEVIGPGTYTANCLGGNCPADVGTPQGTTTPLIVTDTGGKRGDYSALLYSWTFGGDTFLINSISALGAVTGVRTYGSIGAKTIELNVSVSGVSSKIQNNFTINEPMGCSADGLYFLSSGTRFSTLSPAGGICNMGGTGNPICCPRVGDYACLGTPATCQAGACNSFFDYAGTVAAITLCDHYNNVSESAGAGLNKEVQCNNDCVGAGRSTQQLNFIRNTYGISSGYQINNARCAWNVSASKCIVQFTTVSSFGTTIPPVEKFSGCREEIISQSECTSDNYQVVSWKSTAINPADADICNKEGTQTVLCGTPVIALPFFSLGNLIAAIILIVLIYLIISYSKEKKQAKGKGKRRK